jgi:hypothetical protein
MIDLSNGVDPADVRTIYDGEEAPTEAIQLWIDAAEDLVSNRLEASAFAGDQLARITLLVACHNLAAQNPTESKTEVGPITNTYEGVDEPDAQAADLSETRYGRRALSLDDTGNLEAGEEDEEATEDPFVFETYGV